MLVLQADSADSHSSFPPGLLMLTSGHLRGRWRRARRRDRV